VIKLVTWTEIDDFTEEIENLRFEPEKASKVAVEFKELVVRIAKEGLEYD